MIELRKEAFGPRGDASRHRVAAAQQAGKPRHRNDHASVPATLRALFAPQAPPLSARDRWAPPVLSLLSLDEPRTDLPDLSAWVSREPVTPQITLPVPGQPEPPVPGYYRDLVELADMVDQRLPGPTAPPTLGPRARARHVTEEFEDHAEQTRGR